MSDNPDRERRASFRVDDSLPLIVRDLGKDLSGNASPEDRPAEDDSAAVPVESADDGLSPGLRKWFSALNRKLDRILERLPVDILEVPARPVNLSASGMRFRHRQELPLERSVRIKMLLPTLPAKEVVLEGKVVRVEALPGGEYEVALSFPDLSEEIRRAILQHILNRQRKEHAAKKGKA